MKSRVVVTGMSGVTALGNSYEEIEPNLKELKNAVVKMEEWERFDGLHTKLAAPVHGFKMPDHYSRKDIRSMGPISQMSTLSIEHALKKANLFEAEQISDGSTGIAYGSSAGSTKPVLNFCSMFTNNSTRGITATTYIKMMGHTCAVNASIYFGLKGRVIPTSTACTSGSMAVGYAYETIQNGHQSQMVSGGAEELCPSEAAVFDTLFATSVKNDSPKLTPSPFDKTRDGLVLGEGAGTLILEDLELAKKRGANILAEVVGFGTNCDATHVTHPEKETMRIAMELALKDANLTPEDIDYINGHGTATERGDIAESLATAELFGNTTPYSTLKSYFGHTLGACGAIESWLSIEMMNNGWFAPTINLDEVDERCGDLDYIKGKGRKMDCKYIMCNNFAFGGINTSLIFKRWND